MILRTSSHRLCLSFVKLVVPEFSEKFKQSVFYSSRNCASFIMNNILTTIRIKKLENIEHLRHPPQKTSCSYFVERALLATTLNLRKLNACNQIAPRFLDTRNEKKVEKNYINLPKANLVCIPGSNYQLFPKNLNFFYHYVFFEILPGFDDDM